MMNHEDAQAFFKNAAEAFSQLQEIFRALRSNAESDNHAYVANGLIGAGYHIAEDMSEIVSIWADEAGEPWLEDTQSTVNLGSVNGDQGGAS